MGKRGSIEEAVSVNERALQHQVLQVRKACSEQERSHTELAILTERAERIVRSIGRDIEKKTGSKTGDQGTDVYGAKKELLAIADGLRHLLGLSGEMMSRLDYMWLGFEVSQAVSKEISEAITLPLQDSKKEEKIDSFTG